MRCTHYLVIILLLIAQTSFGQIYQNMAQPGYKFSRARFDSVLTIPMGLGNLKNITGGQDTGQIRFNKSDSSIYVWNGRAYIKPIGGGVSDTLKVSVSDTAAMLANYAKTAAVNLKLNISDTASMLSAYARSAAVTSSLALKLNISDTATMLSNYAKTAAVNLKLNISDTATMLSAYARTSALATKLNISDTATMLAPYSRVTVSSYGKNATRDSTILLLSNGTRFAARDSVGGGGNVYTADGSLTSARTLTLNSQPLTIAGTTSSRFFANGNVGIGTTTDDGFKLNVNGTARIENNLSVIKNQNAGTSITIQNTNGTSAANGNLEIVTDLGTAQFGKNSSTYTTYKSINALDTYIYSNSNLGGDIVLQTDGSSAGKIKFASGSVSTPNMTLSTSGSLLIGTTSENTSAILNVTSTTKGVLFPRMNSDERNGIIFPATGLQIYNTSTNTYDYYNGTTWGGIGGVSGWGLTGNASAVTDFLGTTNNRTMRFRTNNVERMVIDSIGNIGIGTGTPNEALHIVKQIGSQAIIKLQTLDNTTTNGYSGVNTFDNSGNLAFSFAYGNPSSALPNSAIIGPRTATGTLSFVTTAAANTQMRMFANGNFTFQTTGTFTDIPSAKVAVNSTTQGVLFPRMTTTQKNAIATPVAGLVVYDTTLNKLCVRTASAWETITSL